MSSCTECHGAEGRNHTSSYCPRFKDKTAADANYDQTPPNTTPLNEEDRLGELDLEKLIERQLWDVYHSGVDTEKGAIRTSAWAIGATQYLMNAILSQYTPNSLIQTLEKKAFILAKIELASELYENPNFLTELGHKAIPEMMEGWNTQLDQLNTTTRSKE